MSGPGDATDQEAILRQRDRIVGSATFASSQRLSALLDYLVTESFKPNPKLKEYAIGVEVFERGERFDPSMSAIVRVEVGRLRTKLREYYDDAGRYDPIRISIPKGAYAPQFQTTASTTRGDADAARPAARHRPRRRWPWWAAACAAVVVVGLVAYWRLQDGSPIPADQVHRVAVLPLRDYAVERADYFSESLTDALIARLSERPELRVTSLSSVLAYKGVANAATVVKEKLGVDHVVEGSVLREADRIRMTIRLIETATGTSVWSQTYERPLRSVLGLQQDVALAIAGRIAGQTATARQGQSREVDPIAFEAFLKGRYWRNRLTAAGFSRGTRYFREAIERQPDYAEAYAGLAACHCQLGGFGVEAVAPHVALPEARALALKATELNDSLAEPDAILGIIAFKYEWDPIEAERRLRSAIDKNPSLFEAHLWLSQVLEGMGRYDLAVQSARAANRINPLSAASGLNLGWQLLQSGDMTAAAAQFDALIEFDPDFWGGYWGQGHLYRRQGDYPRAIAAFSRATELEDAHTLALASLGYTVAIAGERDRALEILQSLETTAENTYVSPMHFAMVHAGLGDSDAALAWLQRAYDVRARLLAWLPVTVEFNALHGDPRYHALLAKIGGTSVGSQD